MSLKQRYPDLSFYVRQEANGVIIYLYKNIGSKQERIATALTISNDVLEYLNSPQLINLMLDEAVQLIRAKEQEIDRMKVEWNPSSRKEP